MDGIEYVGFMATSLATLAFLPQVVRTWQLRSAHDFSLVTLLMLVSGTVLWIVYGANRSAPAIWLGNGVTLILISIILAIKVRDIVGRDNA